MTRFAVIHASHLVTLAGPPGPRMGRDLGQIGLIEDGAFIVEDGRLRWVGRTDDLASFRGETLDVSGQVVLPGFVDCHTHPVFAGDRLGDFAARIAGKSYAEIAASGGGIASTVRRTRRATEDELFATGMRHARAFLDAGTTTVEGKSGYGLDEETELRMLRVLRRLDEHGPLRVIPTYMGAHAVPPEFAADPDGYCSLVEGLVPRVAARAVDVFVESGYFTPERARRIVSRAKAVGLRAYMHVDQFADSGGAALAAELGVDLASHLEYTGSEGIQALAEARVTPVLLPASVYCLGLDRYPDAKEMIARGLPVTLATDFNPGSSPTHSMPFVLSLACTQMRMTPEQALVACTHNAACALRLDGELGSLEVGKHADFTVWPFADWREIPYRVASWRPSQVYVCGTPAVR